jgi:putative flippase GtrA
VTTRKTVSRFAVVGVLATLTHLGVGATLIALEVPPLLANLAAFLTAFGISFIGHHFFSFQGHGGSTRQTFPRFAMVAMLGFICNESLLFVLLYPLANLPTLALLISTASAAVLTYLFSSRWAFRRAQTPTQNTD